jgi:tRNA threonylcarbamoyladenosine biosynthesis protein TsaB
MRLLAVDTTTSLMSAALTDGAERIVSRRIISERTHTEVLLGGIDRLLRECRRSIDEVDGFAVTIGPGAFLAIRVGIATVKGLAMGTGKPGVPVSSLEALAMQGSAILSSNPFSGMTVCPMIDARRQEVYAARYRPDGHGGLTRMGDEALMTPERFFDSVAGPALFLGDGAQLHRAVIAERFGAAALVAPADSDESAEPIATAVARIALGRFGDAVDPALLLPVYFRPAAVLPIDRPVGRSQG